jgi:hypothetical protein
MLFLLSGSSYLLGLSFILLLCLESLCMDEIQPIHFCPLHIVSRIFSPVCLNVLETRVS